MNMKPDYLKAKAYSKVILEESFITEPPINPVKLARSYGLEVISADFKHEKVAGYIDFDKKTIYIAKSDPVNRKTFTIAHELGHWFLHKDTIDRSKIPVLYRNGLLNSDPIEKEANAFAANLLVPTEFLRQYKDDYSVDELAKIFNVSRDVMGFRLMMFA